MSPRPALLAEPEDALPNEYTACLFVLLRPLAGAAMPWPLPQCPPPRSTMMTSVSQRSGMIAVRRALTGMIAARRGALTWGMCRLVAGSGRLARAIA
jgi:hypothetical protein